MLQRKFTKIDQFNGVCTDIEVGLPWEDRWSIDDSQAENCTMHQVGKTKQVQQTFVQDIPEPDVILTDEERRRLLLQVNDSWIIQASKEPEQFLVNHGPYARALMEKVARMLQDEANSKKTAEAVLWDDYLKLSSEQQTLYLVRVLFSYVPREDQDEAWRAMHIGDDAQMIGEFLHKNLIQAHDTREAAKEEEKPDN